MTNGKAKRRSFCTATKLFFARYFARDVWARAFLGIDVEDADQPLIAPAGIPPAEPAAVPEKLFEQLKALYDVEVERAEATRSRSDQLLTQIFVALSSLTAVVTLAFSSKPSGLGWVGCGFLIAAVITLMVSLFLILKNLGRQTFYTPIWIGDLRSDSSPPSLTEYPDKKLAKEYYRAIIHGDLRNNDAIDRRVLAHSLLVVAILFGVFGAMTSGVAWLRQAANPAGADAGVADGGIVDGGIADGGVVTRSATNAWAVAPDAGMVTSPRDGGAPTDASTQSDAGK